MNIGKIFSLENLKGNLKEILERFPFSVFLIILTTTLFFLIIGDYFPTEINENIIRSIFSIILTFFLSVGIYIFSENNNFKINKNLLQLFPISFGILFYFSFSGNFSDFDNIVYFFLTLVGILGFLFISPFIKQIFSHKEISKNYYNYFQRIFTVFLLGIALGGFLFALGAIGISAINYLFDLDFFNNFEDFYAYWATLSLVFITPTFALTQIPEKEELEETESHIDKFFGFLIKNISIPAILVYFVILYSYTIKVLLNFENWPKGEITWLVISFSSFGYLIYMFSQIFEEKNDFVKLFRKFFPLAVIPQTFMLFYAIYLRISQYDFTINRYFVVIFGIWLLIISVYFLISRKKQIYFIPTILTIFTIIISVGPWGVFSLPEKRQFERLQNNLEIAGILKDGKIIPLNNYYDINQNLSKEIANGISYLCKNSDCENIKELFREIYEEILIEHREEFKENIKLNIEGLKDEKQIEKIKNQEYFEPSYWDIVTRIQNKIKVQTYFQNASEPQILNFYIGDETAIFPIEIIGYEKLFRIGSYVAKSSEVSIKYNLIEKSLTISQNNSQIDKIDLSEIIAKLGENYDFAKIQELSKENAIFEVNGENFEYLIFIENISILNPNFVGEGDEIQYYFNNLSGYLFQK